MLQVVSSDRRPEDYEPADLALALCHMVSYISAAWLICG